MLNEVIDSSVFFEILNRLYLDEDWQDKDYNMWPSELILTSQMLILVPEPNINKMLCRFSYRNRFSVVPRLPNLEAAFERPS